MAVTIVESAGVGGNVQVIDVSPVTEAGVELPTITYSSDVIVERVGTNHISAAGSLYLPFTVVYSTGNGNAHLVVNVSVTFTDDLGNQLSSAAQVDVN